MLKLIIYTLKLILLMFSHFSIIQQFNPIVILMRRQHLDNTTSFCVFPKCVILKREKSREMCKCASKIDASSVYGAPAVMTKRGVDFPSFSCGLCLIKSLGFHAWFR